MNTSYLEMTGSFQKIAVRSELSRKNKSKDKLSLDYGLSTLSKLISIDQKTKAEAIRPSLAL